MHGQKHYLKEAFYISHEHTVESQAYENICMGEEQRALRREASQATKEAERRNSLLRKVGNISLGRGNMRTRFRNAACLQEQGSRFRNSDRNKTRIGNASGNASGNETRIRNKTRTKPRSGTRLGTKDELGTKTNHWELRLFR